MKGIYSIKIGDKYYIGKDTHIDKKRRLGQHLNLFRKKEHYNKHFQYAFYKYSSYEYEVLFEVNKISDQDLSEKEKHFIKLFNSMDNGYNLTEGGEGMSGFEFDEESCLKKSIKLSGEKNPAAKLSNNDFFEIVELLKKGWTNEEIAEKYNLHSRYISLIRHKKRFKKLWEQVSDYEPQQSEGRFKNGKITEEVFKDIVNGIKHGKTNAELERKYGLASGCVSRIRTKKNFKQWWKKYFNE